MTRPCRRRRPHIRHLGTTTILAATTVVLGTVLLQRKNGYLICTIILAVQVSRQVLVSLSLNLFLHFQPL